MALTITGRLHIKGQIEVIKENFQKREFIVELSDESPNGMIFTNYVKFQLINSKCDLINDHKPGDLIRVSFALQGNLFEKDGVTNCFTNLNAWRVEPAGELNSSIPGTRSAPARDGSNQPDDLPF